MVLAVVGALVGSGLSTPAGADPATRHLWAVTRDVRGDLHVVRGVEAAIAVATSQLDARLGRAPADTVLSIEEDQPVRALWTNDPLRPQQWALNAVDYESVWPATTGAGVTVAVIDTGVRGDHEDLAGSVVPGTDLAADWPQYDPGRTGMVDPAGHGTHVAGIIAAHANNGLGIAGAAPGAKIMPVRVLDASGSGSSADVATGIIWAADHGARVINLSLGGGESPGMQQAMQYALTKQVVTVAAGGNSYGSGNQPTYPAAYPEAIAVGAVDSSLRRAPYSNTGSYIDIAAPGDLIWSTYGTGRSQYALMSGTSMATPYVSAAAALVVAENPRITASALRQALLGSANGIGAPNPFDPCHANPRVCFGAGLVNPRGAAVLGSATLVNRGTKGNGYWVVTADGRVRTFGAATFHGDLASVHLSAPIVAAARTPTGKGY
ncbi:MAG TPA: S8 family serine peptidase, partial [Acidimicrobiia bacterium]|nr:S8 family serine peptidase [Acidimicrobiia bacterium]